MCVCSIVADWESILPSQQAPPTGLRFLLHESIKAAVADSDDDGLHLKLLSHVY